jgi:Putative MetA-pathway of phenol degradation
MFRLFASVFVLASFLPVPATAQGPGPPPVQTPASPADSVVITAVPNRPTFSTTAESVQPGVFEIEYGFELADGHQNINGLLKFGLTKDLELRFANNPIERDSGVAGRGDSGAGFKYRFFRQDGWRPTVSALYTAFLPTATAGVGAGASGQSTGALVSKDFGQHHLDFNETVQWLGRPGAGGYDRDYFTALAYSHGVRGKWGMAAEMAGFSRANAATPASMTLLGAATYAFSSRSVLDTGIYVAAYGSLPRVTFFTGVTYSVADLYHRRSRPAAAPGKE